MCWHQSCVNPWLSGEVQSPEADESAVWDESLDRAGELLPTLERVQVLLDRVATLAQHLMRQLAAFFDGVERRKDTFARTLRKSSFRPVFDMLRKLLRVPVIEDGLMLENTQFRQAYKSYSWVVSKASARQASGHAGTASGVSSSVSPSELLLVTPFRSDASSRKRLHLPKLLTGTTEHGVFEPGCGLSNVTMTYGHDEYMFNVLVGHGCPIPEEDLHMIHFHYFSFPLETMFPGRNAFSRPLKSVKLAERFEGGLHFARACFDVRTQFTRVVHTALWVLNSSGSTLKAV